MQTPREISENRTMHGIGVALLTEDQDQLSTLQSRLEATRLGQAVFSHVGFPDGPTDAILRQLQDSRAEVVMVDVPARDPQRAIHAIELIRATTQQIGIFANGDMTNPASIVATMRAGPANIWIAPPGRNPCSKLSPASVLPALAVWAGRGRLGYSLFLAPRAARVAPPPR